LELHGANRLTGINLLDYVLIIYYNYRLQIFSTFIP
jgi:hypothetical protein